MKKTDELFKKKIESTPLPELANRLEFIQKLNEIISIHPFLYIPYFISDFISGESKTKLLAKYHLTSFLDLSKIIEILQFKQNRYLKRNYDNAKVMNLKIPRWNEIFSSLCNNCKYFEQELNQFYFEKLLRAYIFVILFDYQKKGLDHFGLAEICKKNTKDFYIFKFADEKLIQSFENLLNQKLERIILQILDDFSDKGFIKRKKSKPSFFINLITIERIKSIILSILGVEITGLRRGSILSRLESFEPGLKEIPGLGIWETSLHELEKEKKIMAEQKFIFRDNDIIHLTQNYQKIKQKINSLDEKNTKFYGRKISPDTFVEELKILDKGDFGDEDDQVTRLAGLVLAESVKLNAPYETIGDFDFSINLKDYDFRPDQLKAMSKLNFVLNSEIFHCKVMLDEEITIEKLEELQKKIPKNEQGIIFSFKEISTNVKQQIETNPLIQIINEDGIKIWVSITEKIPVRVNSISKIHSDPISGLKNKLSLVNSVDYESGLASISVLPEFKEYSVLVRTLEEIQLYENSPLEFINNSRNYLEFLNILYPCSPNLIYEALSTSVKKIKPKWGQNYSTGKWEVVKNAWTLEFEDAKGEINLNESEPRSIFKCDCFHLINQDHSYTLCKHMISTINNIVIFEGFLNYGWGVNEINLVKESLEIFLEMSVNSSVQRIAIELNLNELKIFKNYLENYTNFIESN